MEDWTHSPVCPERWMRHMMPCTLLQARKSSMQKPKYSLCILYVSLSAHVLVAQGIPICWLKSCSPIQLYIRCIYLNSVICAQSPAHRRALILQDVEQPLPSNRVGVHQVLETLMWECYNKIIELTHQPNIYQPQYQVSDVTNSVEAACFPPMNKAFLNSLLHQSVRCWEIEIISWFMYIPHHRVSITYNQEHTEIDFAITWMFHRKNYA